jgi:hypothetical protein
MTPRVPLALLAFCLLAAAAAGETVPGTIRRTVSFDRTDAGWRPLFADHPAGEEAG